MLDELYMRVLDMSMVASVVILAVMLARLALKKAPKWVSYALWAVALVRLLCPVSIQAPVSIVPEVPSVSEGYTLSDEPISFAGAGEATYQAVGDALNGGLGIQHVRTTERDVSGMPRYVTTDWWDVWILFGQYVWVVGMVGMALYSVVSYGMLRRRLRVAAPLRENIFVADDIQSPFVIGFLKPKIYLPCGLGETEREYIILHEQHHIRRLDHIVKALAFLALTVHWFNPLVWAAFVLACKDMEMSCDEAVVGKMGDDIRADYSASLLALATGRRIIAGTPLAFGEGDTRGRIKNLAHWKKPAFWVVIAAVIVCAVLAVCLLTDPQSGDDGQDIATGQDAETEDPDQDAEAEDPNGNAGEEDTADISGETPTETARRIVNSVLVGALSDDESWQSGGNYTLTVMTDAGDTDTYICEPETRPSLSSTSGSRLTELYTWVPCEDMDEIVSGGHSIRFANERYSFTVYSNNGKITLTEDGKTMTFSGMYLNPYRAETDFSALFTFFSKYAIYAESKRAKYSCTVSGEETDYAVIAQKLTEQYAEAITNHPAWYDKKALEAIPGGVEVYDAYYGEDDPNFCFWMNLHLKIEDEMRNHWEVGAGLREPPESGPYAGYYGWGMEVCVSKGEDGNWHITGMATGDAWARLPVPVREDGTSARQLVEMFFLTEGDTHDFLLIFLLAEKPLDEVRAELDSLPDGQRDELRGAILTFIEEYPAYCSWTAEDFP